MIQGDDRVRFNRRLQEMPLADVPCMPLPTEPGDIVAFDTRIFHASLGGGADRRGLNVDYMRQPRSEAERLAIVNNAAHAARQAADSHNGAGVCPWKYSAAWLAGRGRGGVRRQWVESLAAIGYFEAAMAQPNCTYVEPGASIPAAEAAYSRM